MPARIVVALDDRALADRVVSELKTLGQDALAFADSMTALTVFEDHLETIQVLIISLVFPPGQPNGVALARMARLRRPGIRAVFVGEADLEPHTAGLGKLVVPPVTVETLASLAMALLTPDDQNSS
jgi:hypothetical protein